MSVLIAPAVSAGVSAVTGLFSQKATLHAQKVASDVANAQRSNNLADQSYLMVVQRNSQSPPTRYEYDQAVAPYLPAIQSGDINTLRQVGLWTDAYIANIAAQHPVYGPQQLPPQPTVLPPSGSTSQAPSQAMGPQWPQEGSLPSWAVPAGLAAVGLLIVTMMMGRRAKR